MGIRQQNLEILRGHLQWLQSQDDKQEIYDALNWAVHRLDPESYVDGQPKQKKTFPDNSFSYKLAVRLDKWIRHNNPSAKKKPEHIIQKWARVFARMVGDGVDRATMVQALDWSQQNNFWKTNILSATKFSQQFEQLTIKMRTDYDSTKIRRSNGRDRRDAANNIQSKINRGKTQNPNSAF